MKYVTHIYNITFLKIFRKLKTLYLKVYKKILNLFYKSEILCVNIGAGQFVKKGWINLDFRSKHYKDTIYDIYYDISKLKPLPFKDNTVSCFYSEHTFEHLPDNCVQNVMNEVYRCLKKKGGFRIVVPDINSVHEKERGSVNYGLDYDSDNGGRHINFFTSDKFYKMLSSSGFKNIYQCHSQKSSFDNMRGYGFDTRPEWSLHVECEK